MKNNFLKTFGTALIMGFLLIAFAPVNSFAQKRHTPKKKKVVKKQTKQKKVYTPVKHYKSLPHQGAQVTVLPTKAMLIRHGQYNYHFYNGIFYRPVGGTFVVIAPPIGIRVSILPPTPYPFRLLGNPYYYYYGAYYVPHANGGYKVVASPIGARVDALPGGYEIFELDEKVYYRLDDTYYKAVVEENGAVAYEVVKVN